MHTQTLGTNYCRRIQGGRGRFEGSNEGAVLSSSYILIIVL